VLWVSADHEPAAIIATRAIRFGTDPARLHVLYPRNGIADVIAAVELVRPDWFIVDTLSNYATGIVQKAAQSDDWPKVIMPLVHLARGVVPGQHADRRLRRYDRDAPPRSRCRNPPPCVVSRSLANAGSRD
jgi:hypothetical protein